MTSAGCCFEDTTSTTTTPTTTTTSTTTGLSCIQIGEARDVSAPIPMSQILYVICSDAYPWLECRVVFVNFTQRCAKFRTEVHMQK